MSGITKPEYEALKEAIMLYQPKSGESELRTLETIFSKENPARLKELEARERSLKSVIHLTKKN
jgi:vacuolar-type H+-ATPase subunit E/Vma4